MRPDRPGRPARRRAALIAAWSRPAAPGGSGLPGVWIALGLWLAARAALLGRRWRIIRHTGTMAREGAHAVIWSLLFLKVLWVLLWLAATLAAVAVGGKMLVMPT
jgi:hypothetical protein